MLDGLTLLKTRVPRLMTRLSLAALFCSTQSLADDALDNDEDLMSYTQIVEDLNRKQSKLQKITSESRAELGAVQNPLDEVWIHTGLGYVQSAQTIALPNGTRVNLANRGLQLGLGIDLFDPAWAAEGNVRSLSDSDSREADSLLQEFDLKVLYRPSLSDNTRLRFGAGVSGRYLTLKTPRETLEYVTPSSLASAGFDLYLSRSVSFGVDLSYRTSLISETLDRSSFDATARLDARF